MKFSGIWVNLNCFALAGQSTWTWYNCVRILWEAAFISSIACKLEQWMMRLFGAAQRSSLWVGPIKGTLVHVFVWELRRHWASHTELRCTQHYSVLFWCKTFMHVHIPTVLLLHSASNLLQVALRQGKDQIGQNLIITRLQISQDKIQPRETTSIISNIWRITYQQESTQNRAKCKHTSESLFNSTVAAIGTTAPMKALSSSRKNDHTEGK